MTRDRLLGIVSVLFAVLIAGLTFFTVDPKIRIAGDPGSQIFPYGAALIFALAGSRLIMRKAAKKDPIFLTAGQWKRLFILFFAFAVYVFLIWLIGFLTATMIMLFGISTMFASKKGVPLTQRILYAVGMTLVAYGIFRYGLKVMLPSGIIGMG